MTDRAGKTGPFLLDVNVLVALFHPEHVHHETAHDWFADHRKHGWATTPITENGCLRVLLSIPGVDVRLGPAFVGTQLRKFCASRQHTFWSDDLSLADQARFNLSEIVGPRQVTDVYLLGLAHAHGGALATFDRTIPLEAVVGASRHRLHVIGADKAD